MTECLILNCERAQYARGWCKRHYHAHTVGKRRRAKWDRAVELLGGKCVRCGDIENLQFDHIDPATKSYNIAQALDLAWPKLVEELDLCQLLCASCHLLKTADEMRTEVCKRGHPREGEHLLIDAEGKRKCRTCRAESQRKRRGEA